MKKYFIASLLTATFLFSCNTKDTSAVATITKMVETAEVHVTKFDSNVLSALNSKKYNHINIISKSTLDSLNVRIYDLQNMTVQPQEEELRNTAVVYLQSMQSIISAESVYASIKDTTSEKTIQAMDAKNQAAVDKTEAAFSKYKEALVKASK